MVLVLTVILIFAFLLRFRVALDLPQEYPELLGDQIAYAAHAKAFSEILALLSQGDIPETELFGKVYDGGTRPPLYPVIMGFAVWVFGGSVLTMRMVTVVIGVLVVWMAFVAGKKLGSAKGGLLVAALISLWPQAVWFSAFLYTEMLWILLLLALIVVCSRIFERGRRRDFLLVGLLLGLLALTRSATLFLLVLIPGFLLWRLGREALRPVTELVAICAVLIFPWQAVIVAKTGEFLPLSTHGPYNFYESNNDLTLTEDRFQEVKRYIIEESKKRELSYYKTARNLALEWIKENPLCYLWRGFERITYVPVSDLLASGHRLWKKDLDARILYHFIATFLVILSCMIGMAFSGKLRQRGVVSVVLLGTLLPMFLAVAYPRHTMPSIAIALLYSAGLFQPRLESSRKFSLGGTAAVCAWWTGILARIVVGYR